MAKADLSADRVRDILHYSPETGALTWARDIRSGRLGNGISARMGALAGSTQPDGRVFISIGDTRYKAHRLAWLYMTGEWPTAHIDHIDGNPSNNRWDNLRDVSVAVNSQNRRKASSHSSTGMLGVVKDGNRYRARLVLDGKKYSFGAFATPEEAHRAYVEGKRCLHEGCTI